jgi:small redox-active disulfide protein 2
MKKVQILGTGCKKCNDLTANAEKAAGAVGVEIQIEKVTQLNDIMAFGVMTTPGLVIDGKVVSQGKLLTPEQIASHLKD